MRHSGSSMRPKGTRLGIRQGLTAQDRDNAGWQRDLSVSQDNVGNVLRNQEDLTGALETCRASLAIRQGLTAQDPDNAGWQRDLSVSQDNVGNVLRDQGDLTGTS